MAKFNFQNIPRKDKSIKKSFKARDGFKIVNADLGTAEVWIAMALSGDPFLASAFASGLDFHSYIAKGVFNIQVPVNQIKDKYPGERQASKSITFGILYGASAYRIWLEITSFGLTITLKQCEEMISNYFKNASVLKAWLDGKEKTLRATGELLYAQGRIRYIPEVFNTKVSEVEHAVRSGLNTLFQGPASDIMLMGSTDLVKEYLLPNNYIDDRIICPFTIVHDSLASEVRNDLVDGYCTKLKKFLQRHRYFIPKTVKTPVPVDFEIGNNLAFSN